MLGGLGGGSHRRDFASASGNFRLMGRPKADQPMCKGRRSPSRRHIRNRRHRSNRVRHVPGRRVRVPWRAHARRRHACRGRRLYRLFPQLR